MAVAMFDPCLGRQLNLDAPHGTTNGAAFTLRNAKVDPGSHSAWKGAVRPPERRRKPS